MFCHEYDDHTHTICHTFSVYIGHQYCLLLIITTQTLYKNVMATFYKHHDKTNSIPVLITVTKNTL